MLVLDPRGQVLGRGSFVSTDDLAAKIDAYVEWYLATDRPFRWSNGPKTRPAASGHTNPGCATKVAAVTAIGEIVVT